MRRVLTWLALLALCVLPVSAQLKKSPKVTNYTDRPAANAVAQGQLWYVLDCNNTACSTCNAGSGTDLVLCISDGTNWVGAQDGAAGGATTSFGGNVDAQEYCIGDDGTLSCTLDFEEVASSENWFVMKAAADGVGPTLTAEGDDDTNIDINIDPKGTGKVNIGGNGGGYLGNNSTTLSMVLDGDPTADANNLSLIITTTDTDGTVHIGDKDQNHTMHVEMDGRIRLNGDAHVVVDAYDTIPIEWCVDGTAGPNAAETITTSGQSRKFVVRDFNTDADDDVECTWATPNDWDTELITTSYGLDYRVVFVVTEATAFTDKNVEFSLSAVSVADNESLDQAGGTAVASDTGSSTYSQYDVAFTPWATLDTDHIAGLGAGEFLQFNLLRDVSEDNYADSVGVWAIQFRYAKALAD